MTALRTEENQADAWFVLPTADQSDWFRFRVEIMGPPMYDPTPEADGTPRASPYAEGLFPVDLHFP